MWFTVKFNKTFACVFLYWSEPQIPLQNVTFVFMDKLTPEQRKKNMRAVRNKGSKIEIALSKALWKKGIRFRKNVTDIEGKPDIAIKKYKIAVFADSEFWHGKNWETKKHEHKTNADFWHKKIENNMRRDAEVNEYLESKGWKVIRFWGKEILKNPDQCAKVIAAEVKKQR